MPSRCLIVSCSMHRVLPKHDLKRMNPNRMSILVHSQSQRDLSSLQRRLLLSAFDALKPGGKLLYCTCSFSPEENEIPLQHLLERHGEHLKTIPLTLPFDNVTKASGRAGEKRFLMNVSKTVYAFCRPIPLTDFLSVY
jgi:16S rRNA C967 or C1407 C5-methylase (RsmB/RsmF family)